MTKDVDSDFAPDVRGWAIEYVKNKYGEGAVCGIMTMEAQAAKGSVRNCARIIGEKKYGKETALYNLGSAICAEIPSGPNVNLSEHADRLRTMFADNPDALEIINDAVIAEGCCTTTGQHAAGVVIADNGDVRKYLPLMKAKDGKWITQYDKDFIEHPIGLLKFDFLGLINLGVITETLKLIQRDKKKNINVEDIPLDDKAVYKEIFSKGNTGSVFQFESEGMQKLLKNLKPDKIEDLILLNALYRPGPLQYADKVCESKRDPNSKDPYICKELAPILDKTYGYCIYQEQVMQICNKIAGFSLSEADDVRKCMSKKKIDKLLTYKDRFIAGLVTHNAEQKAAENFWEQLVAFGSYA